MPFIKQALTLVPTVLILALTVRGQADAPHAGERLPSISLPVSVVDGKNRYMTGLDKSAFVVYENKSEREVVSATVDDAPVRLGVVFDMSDSVTSNGAELIDEARRGVLDLAKRGNKENEYFVMGFTDRARLLADWTHDSAKVADGLNALPSLQGKGPKTAPFYDALYEALEKLAGGSNAKRALLVVSDGVDSGSLHTLAEVRRLAAERGVLVYALGIYWNLDSGYKADALRRLGELCSATGGWASFIQSHGGMFKADTLQAAAGLKRVMETLALELHNQYTVSFLPSAPAVEGEWRRVEVKVRLPHTDKLYAVRAPEGYFMKADAR